MRFKIRKDKLVSEENIRYVAYGIDVYDGLMKIRSIKDVSLNKNRLEVFIRQCNKSEPKDLDGAIMRFVEEEYTVKEKPYFTI